ncbi:MAG TPA: hypothetical protein VIF81_13925, partial [Pyrinomonadaceae bacterium]
DDVDLLYRLEDGFRGGVDFRHDEYDGLPARWRASQVGSLRYNARSLSCGRELRLSTSWRGVPNALAAVVDLRNP